MDEISLTWSDKVFRYFRFIFNFCILFAVILFTDFSTDYLNSVIRSLIVVENSVFVAYDEFEVARAIDVVSVEVIGPELVFVEGDMIRDKY